MEEEFEVYKQAIKINPDDAKAHYDLGLAYGESIKWKKAIKSYKQAVRINPDYAEAHLELGIAYNITVKYKKAIKAFKESIRIDPDYAEAHYYLGVAYIDLNDEEELNEKLRDSALEQYEILKSLESGLANELFNAIYE